MIDSQHQASEVQVIEAEFWKMTTHPYLLQYIEDAEVEYDIIYFLLEAMKYSSLSSVEKREQILSALFVHSAFKTHEKVVLRDYDQTAKKSRQLTVLAGDFFSSLYHSMLVKDVHSSIIPVFSSAIQEINEEKMSLHFNENKTEEELINRLQFVEGSFLKEIANFYGKEEIGSLAETFFLLKRFTEEQTASTVKYLSAFEFAIHAYQEGEEVERVYEWPRNTTKYWMSEVITDLQRQLQYKLKTYRCIQTTTFYNRLAEWASFKNEVEIK